LYLRHKRGPDSPVIARAHEITWLAAAEREAGGIQECGASSTGIEAREISGFPHDLRNLINELCLPATAGHMRPQHVHGATLRPFP